MDETKGKQMIQQYNELLPAYGRDYKAKSTALDDFLGGLDFIICSPFGQTYCSIRDFKKGQTVNIRNAEQRLVATYEMKFDGTDTESTIEEIRQRHGVLRVPKA